MTADNDDTQRPDAPERRLRLLHLQVTPLLVWDDGESITPGPPATTFAVPLGALDELAPRIRADLTRLQEAAQLDAQLARPSADDGDRVDVGD